MKNEIIIDTDKTTENFWKDLWHYRELFYFLAWRDILVRYKQTIIGIAWSVIRPFLTMIIFVIVFGSIAKLPSGGVPYTILVFAAMIPWQFFANSITESSNSLISNSSLISKIYFPRIIIPASFVIVGVVDFLIAFALMILFMIFYNFKPSVTILMLPIFLLQVFILSFGTGLWFSALNVKYRDIRHIVPFIVQIGLYISPVGFNSNIIPEKWKLLYSLNPMVGVIDGFRWSILGSNFQIFIPGLILSIAISLIIFISGLWYFKKTEKYFADII